MEVGKVWKSYAKVNVFLKVIGLREGYHELSSRFVLVKDLYDEMRFEVKGKRDEVWCDENGNGWLVMRKEESLFSAQDLGYGEFELEGRFPCSITKNTIYKAYVQLLDFFEQKDKMNERQAVIDFFKRYKLVVRKRIAAGSWLGGGSSNAAVFLKMVDEALGFDLSLWGLWKIGQSVGSDVNFFLTDRCCANVRGVGEKIEQFEDDEIDLKIFTPPIHCSTPQVFSVFREKYWDEENVDVDFVREMEMMSTKDILMTFEREQLNDLYEVSLDVYPELIPYVREGLFFSGSGSSFFKI